MRPTTAQLHLQPRQAGGARLPRHQLACRAHRAASGRGAPRLLARRCCVPSPGARAALRSGEASAGDAASAPRLE